MKSARKEKVRQRDDQLTPQALLERAARQVTEGVIALIRAELARTGAANDWVDQHNSPLGKSKHLRLVREGKLVARKEGKQVLVRRDDMNAYIEKEGLARGHRTDDEDVDDILDTVIRGARS